MSFKTQKWQSSQFRWLIVFVILFCVFHSPGCSETKQCTSGISDLSIDPNKSPCKAKCDCNNQAFEGDCVQGACVAFPREFCEGAGKIETCISQLSRCNGTKKCFPSYLSTSRWGDCLCGAPPKSDAGEAQPEKTTEPEKTAHPEESAEPDQPNPPETRKEPPAPPEKTQETPNPPEVTKEIAPETTTGCNKGEKADCYDGPPGSTKHGACKKGIKRCVNGKWTKCEGQVLPQPEQCDGKDNDCDGKIDNNCTKGCLPTQSLKRLNVGKEVYSMAWVKTSNPTAKVLMFGTIGGEVHRWEVQKATSTTFGTQHSNDALSVAVNPKGTLVASGSKGQSKQLIIRNYPNGTDHFTFKNTTQHTLNKMDFFHGSTLLALVGAENGQHHLFASRPSTTPGKWLFSRVWKSTDMIRAVAFHPKNNILAIGTDTAELQLFPVVTTNPISKIFDTPKKYTFSVNEGWIMDLAWAPKTAALVTANQNGSISVLKVNGQKLSKGNVLRVSNLPTGKKEVYQVAFSPAENYLAAAYQDGRVRLWNPQTNKLLQTLSGHSGPVRALAVSHDGTMIATGSDDKSIRIWKCP